MTSLLEQHKAFITFLNTLDPKDSIKIISLASKPQINSISEIFANFLKLNLTQDPAVIRHLKPYKSAVRSVACKKNSIKKKKKILRSKRGGAILSFLIPLATSLIGSLLTR